MKIELSQGKVTVIDDEDFELVSPYQWHAYSDGYNWYAVHNYYIGKFGSKKKYGSIRMHRLIMNCPNGFEIDHIDGNGLNNQKVNLRVCTHKQNCGNMKSQIEKSSNFKGVTFDKESNKWMAQIFTSDNGKRKRFYLGRFNTQKEAAQAYNLKAKELFGEYARLNKIHPISTITNL